MWERWKLGILIVALFCISVLLVAISVVAARSLVTSIIDGTFSLSLHSIALAACMIPGTILLLCLFVSLRAALSFRLSRGGVAISRREAPQLWRLADEWSDRVGAPRLHRIEIGQFLQATVTSHRPWLVGPIRHTLSLGEPLLLTLDAQEATAVLVHELAHLRHMDTNREWLHNCTHALLATLEASIPRHPTIAHRVICRLRRGHARAHSEFMRLAEAEADATAARFIGVEVTARALIRLNLVALRGERRLSEALDDGLTRRSAMRRLDQLRRGSTEPDARDGAWLRMLLERPSTLDCTHPSLGDRLCNLGLDLSRAQVPDPVPGSASAATAWGIDHADALEARSASRAEPTGSTGTPRPPLNPAALRDLIDMIESSETAAHFGHALLLHDWLGQLGEQPAIERLLEDVVACESVHTDTLMWAIERSLRRAAPEGVVRAMRGLDRLEDRDATQHATAMAELADRLSFDGRIGEARAAWRWIVRFRESGDHPSDCPESSLLESDLSSVREEDRAIRRIAETLGAQTGIDRWSLARLHGELDDMRPRLLVAITACRRWWSRARNLRRLRAALGSMRDLRLEIVDFDRCTRPVQDRLRILSQPRRPEPCRPVTSAGT
jgi:Zn-dependent protease with chaperone function